MAYIKTHRAADSSLVTEQSFRQHKDEVQVRLDKEWGVRRPDSPPPRVDELLEFMADDLGQSRELMISSLNEHLDEVAGDGIPRGHRKDAVQDMRSRYVFIRDHCVNTYGEAHARKMGFDLFTEQHPWRLARQTARVLDNFTQLDPEEVIPPEDPAKAVTAIKAGDVVGLLEAPHESLTQALGTLLVETKQSESTLIQKNEDFDAYARKYSRYASVGEALFRMVGMDEEAARIKPSQRRPGLRDVVARELEGPDQDPPPPEPGDGDPQPVPQDQDEPAPSEP